MPKISSFRSDERGAVAATYAIALFGLVAIAGVGFDYARMAGMHSELQNGADQAALAAATQLDKGSGACARASAAAVGMLRNVTLLANDGDPDGNAVTFEPEPNCDATGFIRFWQNREGTTAATSDADARFVEVVTTPRVARYALTPIVDALDSGEMRARAMAGIGSAICRVPPLMICNPAEPETNLNVLLPFDVEANRGAGIKLVANNSYTPGAFGFLETGSGNSANQLLAALGWDVRRGDCVSIDGVEVKEGLTASVMDGINTRFDMPGSGNSCPTIGGVTGQCSPSINVRKDLVRKNTGNNISWSVHEGNAGNFATEAYRPTSRALYPSTVTPRIMGHPRDLCHAWSNDGDCPLVNGNQSPRLGNGEWDIDAYWRSNYGTSYPAGTIATNSYGTLSRYTYPTRYQVYRWESEKLLAGTLPGVVKDAGTNPAQAAYAQPQAGQMLALPSSPYGRVPGSDLDRRRLSVAVLNCSALTNSANGYNNLNNRELTPTTWIDIFMVEPAIARSRCQGGGSGCNNRYTENTDVYVELIERTDIGGSSGANLQTIRRDVPYLIE
ncbi:TadE/TadG family type IV pilus assembly protein [Qipengyuania atrilutea]|uniref:Pilus assembly protein n=1 Tax=Qipengyuania atrilutea TaxID=2744473 RepID=A0A850H8W5_9SPHN|nr:pilus assembly protein TadG-related protein [Actirhodobacter atriluteus]NVD43529.1 pilus assembly protein [Actirhodobacter atriluteus]